MHIGTLYKKNLHLHNFLKFHGSKRDNEESSLLLCDQNSLEKSLLSLYLILTITSIFLFHTSQFSTLHFILISI